MPAEKRYFTRVPFRTRAELKTETETAIAQEICDLSMGGCFLALPIDLSPQTPCRLKIMLSGTSSELVLNIEGIVTRKSAAGVAVEFSRMDDDTLFHLTNIIRYNSQNPETVEWELLNLPHYARSKSC